MSGTVLAIGTGAGLGESSVYPRQESTVSEHDDLRADEQVFLDYSTWVDRLLLHFGLMRYRMALSMRNSARIEGVKTGLHYQGSLPPDGAPK